MRSVIGASVLAAAALLPACSTNSCPYGSGASEGSCKGRGGANAHQSVGWHTASLRARAPVAARAVGARVIQVTVNQYGELWAYTGNRDHVVLDVGGHSIKPRQDNSATGDLPFATEDFRPTAIDKAMEYIRPRAPSFDFIYADLYASDFGHDKGLRWHLHLYSRKERRARSFIAAPDGRVLCEHVLTGDATTYVRISGGGCPNRGFS